MNIKQLRYFLQIAEAQSFNKAASRVRVTQPALSRQMKFLEEELGVQLFDRHGRGVALTDAGLLLRERADGIIRHVEQVRSEVIARQAQPTGEVALGSPPAFSQFFMSDIVCQFVQLYPEVKLSLLESQTAGLRDLLANGRIDLGVITSNEPEEELKCTPFVTESLFLVGPPQCNYSLGEPLSLNELKRTPLVQGSWPNSLRVIVERAMARIGAEPIAHLQADGITLPIELVRAGQGHTVLPYSGLHASLKEGKITAAPVRGLHIRWLIASHSQKRLSVSGQMMKQMLLDKAKELVAAGNWPTGVLNK